MLKEKNQQIKQNVQASQLYYVHNYYYYLNV